MSKPLREMLIEDARSHGCVLPEVLDESDNTLAYLTGVCNLADKVDELTERLADVETGRKSAYNVAVGQKEQDLADLPHGSRIWAAERLVEMAKKLKQIRDLG